MNLINNPQVIFHTMDRIDFDRGLPAQPHIGEGTGFMFMREDEGLYALGFSALRLENGELPTVISLKHPEDQGQEPAPADPTTLVGPQETGVTLFNTQYAAFGEPSAPRRVGLYMWEVPEDMLHVQPYRPGESFTHALRRRLPLHREPESGTNILPVTIPRMLLGRAARWAMDADKRVSTGLPPRRAVVFEGTMQRLGVATQPTSRG